MLLNRLRFVSTARRLYPLAKVSVRRQLRLARVIVVALCVKLESIYATSRSTVAASAQKYQRNKRPRCNPRHMPSCHDFAVHPLDCTISFSVSSGHTYDCCSSADMMGNETPPVSSTKPSSSPLRAIERRSRYPASADDVLCGLCGDDELRGLRGGPESTKCRRLNLGAASAAGPSRREPGVPHSPYVRGPYVRDDLTPLCFNKVV